MTHLTRTPESRMMLFSGRSHPELADQVAAALGQELAPSSIYDFANGEIFVRYLESVANDAGVANPIGNAVKNSYATAVASGHGEDYVPMLSDWIAGLNGVSLADKS